MRSQKILNAWQRAVTSHGKLRSKLLVKRGVEIILRAGYNLRMFRSNLHNNKVAVYDEQNVKEYLYIYKAHHDMWTSITFKLSKEMKEN
jgi:hypothetical protein